MRVSCHLVKDYRFLCSILRLSQFRAEERGSKPLRDRALVWPCFLIWTKTGGSPRLERIRNCKKVLRVTWSSQLNPQSTPSQDGRGMKSLEMWLAPTFQNLPKGLRGFILLQTSGEKKTDLFKRLDTFSLIIALLTKSLARTIPWNMATCWGETHFPELSYPKEMLGNMHTTTKNK